MADVASRVCHGSLNTPNTMTTAQRIAKEHNKAVERGLEGNQGGHMQGLPHRMRVQGEPMRAVEFWTARGKKRYAIVHAEDGYQWGTARTINEAFWRAQE